MRKTLVLVLTLMLTGRAMTLDFVHRAGGAGVGDPPLAWLMPLIGDAVVGLSGLAVAYLIWTRRGLAIWTVIVVWNAIAIWDAMSAFIIHLTVPWPAFFMVQIFGSSMFFLASAMHLVILLLVLRDPLRSELIKENAGRW